MAHEFSRPGTQREAHPRVGSSQRLKNHGLVHASGNFAFDISETSISPMSFGIPGSAARARVSFSDALKASQLHNILTGTSFGTAVLAASEMEAKECHPLSRCVIAGFRNWSPDESIHAWFVRLTCETCPFLSGKSSGKGVPCNGSVHTFGQALTCLVWLLVSTNPSSLCLLCIHSFSCTLLPGLPGHFSSLLLSSDPLSTSPCW